jgi:hypothetical protein
MGVNIKKVAVVLILVLFVCLNFTNVEALKIEKKEKINIKDQETLLKQNQKPTINKDYFQIKDLEKQKKTEEEKVIELKLNQIKSRLIEIIYTKVLSKIKFFNDFEIESVKLNVYSKWKSADNSLIDKITPISKSPFYIDINDDGTDDIKITYNTNLDIVEVIDFEDILLDFPFALAMIADIQISRTEDSCINDGDYFECSAQIDFPSLIFTEEKSLNIGGFKSIEDNKVPEDFKISYKYIPYALRNLIGMGLSPEFWITYDPGSIEDSELKYTFGIDELEGSSGVFCELKNNPAKPFSLKFKTGFDKWKFAFDSNDGAIKNSNLSFFKLIENKKIGASFNFKDIKKVDFDVDLNVQLDNANILFYSHNNLNFNLNLFDQVKQSFLKTGINIKNGISIYSEIKKDFEFSINVNHAVDLYDLTFEKPNLNLDIEDIICKKSGSFDFYLSNLGLNLSSRLDLEMLNIDLQTTKINLLVSKLAPTISGFFELNYNEDKKGFKIGSDVDLSIKDASIKHLSTDISVGFYGLIGIQAGGWIEIFKENSINNVKLKLYSMAFEFSNIDFKFNKEQFSIGGLFDFDVASEKVLHLEWRKPDIFRFNFDKDLKLNVYDFYFSNPKSWFIDKVNIQEFSWDSGRNFEFDVSSNALLIDIDSEINISSSSIVYNNGASLRSDNMYFEGKLDFNWEEESLSIDVETKLDWDLSFETVYLGSWDIFGFLQGDIQLNSEWETDEKGILELISGSDGFCHDFIIVHKGLELHLGTIELTQGNLLFNWQKGDNGFIKLTNNGIQANLNICKLIQPDSSFEFEIGSISLIPGDTTFGWADTSDILHFNLDSGIDFDIGLIKLSQADSSISASGLDIAPGIFDFKWFRNEFKMEIKNSIGGFEPKLNFQTDEESFNVSLFGLNSNYKTMTFQLHTNSDLITGFSVDTNANNCANLLECEYKNGNNYGRKLSLYGLNADGFIINLDAGTLQIDGKIGGSRFIFSDIQDDEWHLIADTQWDINGDGEGFFKLISDPELNIELQSIGLLSNYNIEIDTTVFAPSFINLSWESSLIPPYIYYTIDTNGQEIGHLEFDIKGEFWRVIIEGTSFATENFMIGWEFLLGFQRSGTLYPGSLLAIKAYIDDDLIIDWSN